MTRRAWLAAAAASALAPVRGQLSSAATCPKPLGAPPSLFPSFLQGFYEAIRRPKLFGLKQYDDLPPAVISPANTVRIPVEQMSRDEYSPALELLRAGYRLMRSDVQVTGFALQASLHNLYCFGGGAHDRTGGIFLAWHRALLYYHERLLRWHLERAGVAGADKVAVPYWDVVSFSESGGVYSKYPELDHPYCRTWISPDAPTSTQAVGQLRLGIAAPDLLDCGNYLFAWHLAVHCYVGGDMKTLQNAAFDPIFFALHASVDRAWTNSRSAPLTPSSNTCTFYDPYAGRGGAWVRVDLKDFGATAKIGVTYAPPCGASAWISELAVPPAVEIELPDNIGEGVSLYVGVRGAEFDLGEILSVYAAHADHRMPSRFAISGQLGGLLESAKRDDVQFFLKTRQGAPILVHGNWRLILSSSRI